MALRGNRKQHYRQDCREPDCSETDRRSTYRVLSHQFPRWRGSWRAICLLILVVCGVASSLASSQSSGMTLPSPGLPSPSQLASNEPPNPGTVDWIPERYQLGQQLYLENCSSCHVAVPPQTLPTQTWQQLLQDSQHYGVQIQPLVDPQRVLVWNYLRLFSRPLTLKEEQVPFRLNRSRYFKALHPKVEFSQPVNLETCGTCHPGASAYDFRKLTPEWQNAP